jgi:formate hydrogenlyase subunit 4
MDVQSTINTIMIVILGTAGLALFGIVFGLFYKGIDRKISAHMQGRIGPPLVQPFRDVRKLFTKENIVPENAVPWVFHMAPLIGLIGAISILLYLPIVPQADGGLAPLIPFGGDMILILYLLIIPSLALVIGGFASGSPYATVGAQREMATMIAYEFPLAIIIITLAWKLGSTTSGGLGLSNAFAISTITANPVWHVSGPFAFIGFIILLIVLVIVTPAELSKIPFDAPEAETEIGGGLLVEYSGRNLAMFYLMDSVKTVVMASIIVALFFPYQLSPVIGIVGYPGAIIDFIFFLVKVLIIIVFSVTLIRVAVARLKIDQIVYTYWVPLTLLALVGLIFIMWEGWTFSPDTLGWEPLFEMLGLV